MTGRLIQLSGVIVDLIYRIDAVPAPGDEAVVHDFVLAAGGGFNAMVAARRAGMEVLFAGTLGTGPLADIVEAALAAEGIASLRPRLSGQDQGVCTVLVDRDGERSFIASAGADGVLRDADLDALPIAAGDWTLLSGYALSYPGSQPALTRWLSQPPNGLQLVFDPCPLVARIPQTSLTAAMTAAAWITANASEAEHLTGERDPERAAAKLARGRTGGALVRMGAAGCCVATPSGDVSRLPGHAVVAVDTNGAGDAHTGTFVAMLAAGETPVKAAKIANIAAALSTTRQGPATAPPLSEVLEVLSTESLAAEVKS
jgi:sugar/nucleoside kinase (ribokinase family)